jgi:hypothetical protein
MISSAKVRLHLHGNFTLDDLDRPQLELLSQLKFTEETFGCVTEAIA